MPATSFAWRWEKCNEFVKAEGRAAPRSSSVGQARESIGSSCWLQWTMSHYGSRQGRLRRWGREPRLERHMAPDRAHELRPCRMSRVDRRVGGLL